MCVRSVSEYSNSIMQIELVLLVISALFFASILVNKAGSRLGVPALLLFLLVGMLFGSDGLGIQFDNIQVAQGIGTVALCIILFSGGMDTRLEDVKAVVGVGLSLATIGVLITALVTGLVIWFVMGKTEPGIALGLLTSLLLASTMSSTDSASVFSVLRSSGMKLKHNLRPVLELESGSNDPMAYVLTVTFISLVLQGGQPHYGMAIFTVLTQLLIGALLGYLFGKFFVRMINRINIDNVALYPILVLSACIFIFAATYYLKGNSYLAVYIGGLVLGNSKFVHKRSTRNFFEGISWLSQLMMFLTLGLLVNPSEMKGAIVPGLIVSLVMIFFARPISVFLSMMPFRRYTLRDKLFISWTGLRGAVPIIFAILCRAEGVPHSEWIFNIVFFCTLVSLVVQGTTLPIMAHWLRLAEKPKERGGTKDFDIDFPEEIMSATCELEMTQEVLSRHGHRLMDLGMPEKTLVIMVKRNSQYFVPTGKTTLHVGDRLMVLTDNEEELHKTKEELGIPDEVNATAGTKKKNKRLGDEVIDILTTNPRRILEVKLKDRPKPLKDAGKDIINLAQGIKGLGEQEGKKE